MVMVYVPAGQFEMGSTDGEIDAALQICTEYRESCDRAVFADEQPAHNVELDAFWIDQTEVTNNHYRRCVEAEVCEEPTCWDNDSYNAEKQPAVCVTWQQAQTFCEWAGGRLPTEAEWEYTAAGPENLAFPWGNEFDGSRMNHCDINCAFYWLEEEINDGYALTAPVGNFPRGASWVGALDMSGNVWEWVGDWYGEYASQDQSNPTGPTSGERRVLRGGSWDIDAAYLRSAVRNWGRPESSSKVTGFRCVIAR
jgi:formylglycine-generating enzyme required for sulfatase activity